MLIGKLALAAVLLVPVSHTPATSWPVRTCSAFAAYETHPSTTRLDTLLNDSEHVPWRNLGWDVTGLYTDTRDGSAAYYVHQDVRYVTKDCS